MAVIKYKDENGNYQPIVGVNVQNEVVQTTGQSTTAVMSLKAVSDLVPTQASSSNLLADKEFVNSSITTATATYQGNYNLVSDLGLTISASHGQIEQALNTHATGANNNDYSFVLIPTSDSTPTEIASVERYKHNGTTWSYEYVINNSGFTAAQWAAVNSNITSGLVAKLNQLSGNTQNSIANLFGMDSSGNFQNISINNLASVLEVRRWLSDAYNVSVGHTYKFDFSRFVGVLSLVHPFQYFILFVGQIRNESPYKDLQVNVVVHKENIRRVGIYKNGNDLYIKIFDSIDSIAISSFDSIATYGSTGIVLADDVDVSTMEVII